MKKLSKLVLAYALLLVVIFSGHYASIWLTGVTHPNSIFEDSRGTVVEYGHAYRSLYTGELIFYSVMLIVLVSIWILHSEKYSEFTGAMDYILASKKINIISGVIFSFASFGAVLTGKTVPDPVLDFLTKLNLSLVLLVALRFVAKEAYLFVKKRSKI